MKRIYSILGLFGAMLALLSGAGCVAPHGPQQAQGDESVPSICASLAAAPVVIDGVADEPVWRNGTPVSMAIAGRDAVPRMPAQGGEVMLAWDADNLYVFARLSDADIVQEEERDQTHLYSTGDTFEVFLHNDESTWYWEFHAAPNGRKTMFWYPGIGRKLPSCFDARSETAEIRVAAAIDGTLNDWRDRDKGWNVEIAIPAKILMAHGDPFGPGAAWGILFARYNYCRYMDRELSVWPRISWANFHLLHEYAKIRFEEPAATTVTAPSERMP